MARENRCIHFMMVARIRYSHGFLGQQFSLCELIHSFLSRTKKAGKAGIILPPKSWIFLHDAFASDNLSNRVYAIFSGPLDQITHSVPRTS